MMAEFIRRVSALFEPNSTPAFDHDGLMSRSTRMCKSDLKSRATADLEYRPSYTEYAVNCGTEVPWMAFCVPYAKRNAQRF